MTKAPAQVLHSTKHQFLEVVSPQFQYAITNKLQLGVIMKSHRLCSRATKLWSSKLPAGEVVSQISSREFEHPAIHISILCAWCMYIDLSIDLSLSLSLCVYPLATGSQSTHLRLPPSTMKLLPHLATASKTSPASIFFFSWAWLLAAFGKPQMAGKCSPILNPDCNHLSQNYLVENCPGSPDKVFDFWITTISCSFSLTLR